MGLKVHCDLCANEHVLDILGGGGLAVMLFQRIRPLPETVLEHFQPSETDGAKTKERES